MCASLFAFLISLYDASNNSLAVSCLGGGSGSFITTGGDALAFPALDDVKTSSTGGNLKKFQGA